MLSILAVACVVVLVGMVLRKLYLISRIKNAIFLNEPELFSKEAPEANISNKMKELVQMEERLRGWEFLVDDMQPKLIGLGVYYPGFLLLKEFLTIFFILTFIGEPVAQIVPCVLLTFISLLIILLSRPYKRKINNVLNFSVESAYFFIFLGFLMLASLKNEPGNLGSRNTVGTAMIILICVIIARCMVDMIIGIIDTIRYIRKYCKKSEEPKDNQRASE